MLTREEAVRIGIDACIEKMGRDYYDECRKAGMISKAECEHDGMMFCIISICRKPTEEFLKRPRLSLKPLPKYRVSCDVNMKTGEITFIEVILPKGKKTA